MKKTLSIACFALLTGIGAQTFAAERPLAYGDLSPDNRWVYVGGDSGWDPAPHALARQNGKWVHVDKLGHGNPQPPGLGVADRPAHEISGD